MSLSDPYVLGSIIHVEGKYTDEALVPIDPTRVVIYVTDPDGVEVIYDSATSGLDNPEVGTWAIDIQLTLRGDWHARTVTVSPDSAAEDVYVCVSGYPDPVLL